MRRFTQLVTMTDPFQITVLFVTLTFTQQDHWMRSETFFISKPFIIIKLLGCVTHVDSLCFYKKHERKLYSCMRFVFGKQQTSYF